MINTILKNSFFIFIFSGCATITSQSNWPVNITSYPSNANFTITDEENTSIKYGTTPALVFLDSGAGYFDAESYTLTFNKNGFQEKSVKLNASVNGRYWGNFLFGGLWGFVFIDPATGAMFKLPDSIHTDLDETHITEQANANP